MLRVALVDAQQDALAFLLQVGEAFEVGHAGHFILARHKLRQVFSDQIMVLHGCQRQIDPRHMADAPRPEPGGIDDVLGRYRAVLGVEAPVPVRQRRQRHHAVAQYHLGAALARRAGEGVGRAMRIDCALVRIEQTAQQSRRLDDRAGRDDFLGGCESRADPERFIDGRLGLEPLPARRCGGQAVPARHVHANVLATLLLDLLVQFDRVGLQGRDIRILIQYVKARSGMPGGAGSEFRAFDQRDISPAAPRKVIQHARADDAATDNHHPIMRLHKIQYLRKLGAKYYTSSGTTTERID